jgi:hypothetical protein
MQGLKNRLHGTFFCLNLVLTPPTTAFFMVFIHKNNAKLPVTFYPTVNYVREVEDDHQT